MPSIGSIYKSCRLVVVEDDTDIIVRAIHRRSGDAVTLQ
jgi:hypothetical protein